MDDQELRRRAKKRVKAKKGFIMHFAVFIAVMLLLFFLNRSFAPGFSWATIVLLGWGIGIVAHFIDVYGFFGIGGHDWEEMEMEKEMMKLESQKRFEENESLDLEDHIELERRWEDDELV